MNCRHVQELLPLYVGRELEGTRAQMVTAHLQSCVECAGSAHEYRESRLLLQQFAPPPFNEEIYAGIRRQVWREIAAREAPGSAETLPSFVASLFRPRLRWAAASVLMLAACALSFYFISSRGAARREVVDVQPEASSPTPETTASGSPSIPGPGEEPRPPFKRTDAMKSARMTIAGSADDTHSSRQKKPLGVAAAPLTAVAANTRDQRPVTAEASSERNNRAESDVVAAPNPDVPEKTLRLEIQTNDPNIRIIWFSPQPEKKDSPNNFSKGT